MIRRRASDRYDNPGIVLEKIREYRNAV